jgi:hypothetical protein
MKIAIIVCSLGAFVAAAIGLRLLSPGETQQTYYRTHNEVERIAFSKDGSDELRQAVTDERIAEKSLYVIRDIAHRVIGISVAFSGTTLVLGLLVQEKRKTPSQPPQTD